MEAEGGNWLKVMVKDGEEFFRDAHACLFGGTVLRAEMVRSRVPSAGGNSFGFDASVNAADEEARFETANAAIQLQKGRKA